MWPQAQAEVFSVVEAVCERLSNEISFPQRGVIHWFETHRGYAIEAVRVTIHVCSTMTNN